MTVLAEARGISSESFFESNQENVAELLDVLQVPVQQADDLEEVVAHTQRWVAGDHHTPIYSTVLTLGQERDARLLFEKMGLTDEQAPPAGEYEQVVILGGMMGINNERTRYAAEQLVRPDVTLANGGKVVFWGGPRLPLGRELPAIESSIRAARQASPQDPWLHTLQPGMEKLVDETSQGRLSLLTYFGNLALSHIDLRVQDGELVKGYNFDAETASLGALRLVLMNGRTVSRENVNGLPRHTTESCTAEWLESDYAPTSGSPQVMFVTNNPHTRRTTASTQVVIDRLGADHIDLVGCGPAAYEDANTSLYLGEIGRLLYTDLVRQQASPGC